MSKIGIISDIHGNYPALQVVMNQLVKADCEQIICLGDIVGYYCMVNECIELLQEKNVHCLQGNHETYLLGKARCPRSRSVMDCIRYQQKIIKREYLDWLAKLIPMDVKNDMVIMHGGLKDPVDEYVKDFDFKLGKMLYPDKLVFFSGHSHIQSLQRHENRLYCNPGSVGQPRDHISSAAYAIFDDGDIYLERVNYDIDEIGKQMERAGFSDYYYRNLYQGKRIGEK